MYLSIDLSIYLSIFIKLHITAQSGPVIRVILCMYVCMDITYSKSKDQPGKVANPARGQLSRENEYFPVPVCA